MKNILKNASLFIVAMVFTFGFAINAKADDCEGLDYNHCRIGARGAIKVYGGVIEKNTKNTKTKYAAPTYSSTGVNTTHGLKYYHIYNDEINASLFCLDAHEPGKNNLYAERFLLHTGVGIVQIFDAGVMSVLTNGGPTSYTNNTEYWAKLMAIRALTYTFGFYNTSNLVYPGAFYSGLTVTHNWNEFYKTAFNNLNSAITGLGMGALSNPAAHDGYNFTGDTVNKAAEYYVQALNDAAAYARKLANMPKVENLNPTAGEVEKNEVSEGNVFVQKDVVHTLKLSKFSKENKNKFIINAGDNNTGIKLDGNYEGLTAYISKVEISGGRSYNSREEVATLFGRDLVETSIIPNFPDGSLDVEVKITVHFEGWESSTDSSITTLKCGQAPIKYSIDGSYDDGLQDQFGDYVGVVWYSNVPNNQRYVSIEERKEGGPAVTPWESKYETYLIDACSCDNLIDACKVEFDRTGNPNNSACIELKESNCGVCAWLDASCRMGNNTDCEKYNLECDLSCDTYVDKFECCDEQGDLIVSTLDDHEVSILGPGKDNPDASSVKACFVNKMDQLALNNGDGTYKNNANIDGVKDQKNNTYTLADMKDNKYCSVSCKEDYIMTMPTAKLVNAGRYFTFKAKVEGNKVCYTNTIDREKYNKDIIEKQEDMINKYNEYRKWYYLWLGEITPIEGSYTGHSCWCSSHGCGPSCDSTDYFPQWQATAIVPDWTDVVTKPLETGVVTIRQHQQPVSDTNTYQQPTGATSYSCPGGSWSCSCGKDCTTTCSCSGGSTTYYTGHETVCDEGCYRNILKGRMEAAKSALIAAEEAYKEVLKEYDECSNWESEINYDPEVYYDYSEDDYMNMLTNHIGEMEKNVSNSSTSEWYCNSRVTSGSGNELKGQLSDQNYEQCNYSNNGHNTTSLNYIYCDPNGTCKITPERVSDARYKKVTSGVTANYRPATLFYNVYPTGEITTSKSDDNTALENKLPVALNRERGIYKYQVKMERLGEFYDQAPKNNLGRYVGSTTAVVDPNTLEYNCSYLVNITKTTGWVCDFDDTCDDDCIANCIGPNCDDYCDGTDCIADCIGLGCIYDSGAGSSILEKVVSLNNLFPNGTNSYNWDVTKTGKAQATVTAIEEKGNSIFDADPILSITLTPSSAREIKKYNNDVLDDGGYSNKTVSCENRNGIEEIVCYSTFIDDLLTGEFGNVVNENSLIAEESYRHGENSEYFSLWPNGFSEEDMIGPAWK